MLFCSSMFFWLLGGLCSKVRIVLQVNNIHKQFWFSHWSDSVIQCKNSDRLGSTARLYYLVQHFLVSLMVYSQHLAFRGRSPLHARFISDTKNQGWKKPVWLGFFKSGPESSIPCNLTWKRVIKGALSQLPSHPFTTQKTGISPLNSYHKPGEGCDCNVHSSCNVWGSEKAGTRLSAHRRGCCRLVWVQGSPLIYLLDLYSPFSAGG